jgi:alpha-galactosidase
MNFREATMRIVALLSTAVLALASLTAASQTSAPAKTLTVPRQLVAQTPPMGWNSWNFFAERVSDKDIRAAADQLVATGMKDAGYIYVNIDDAWQGQRDAYCTPMRSFPT